MKPILFNAEMVRAILDGRKGAFRLMANINPDRLCQYGQDHEFVWDNFTGGKATGFVCRKCGYGVSPPHSRYPVGTSVFRPRYFLGDILYVRESWSMVPGILRETPGPVYRADFTDAELDNLKKKHFRWKPSIHMPKEAARLFLRVTGVGIERLLTPFFADGSAIMALKQEGIKIPDECMECINNYGCPSCIDTAEDSECGILDEVRYDFSILWDKTIPENKLPIYGWSANPWVWVYRFERISKEEAQEGGEG